MAAGQRPRGGKSVHISPNVASARRAYYEGRTSSPLSVRGFAISTRQLERGKKDPYFGKVLILRTVFIGKVCFLLAVFIGKVYFYMVKFIGKV